VIERALFLVACAAAYVLAFVARRRHRAPVLLVAAAAVAVLLLALGSSHRDAFRESIAPFTWLLSPMTVALAAPLERARREGHIDVAKSGALLAVSALGAASLIVGMVAAMGAPWRMRATLAPRAATSALSVPTAEALGGWGPVASVVVALSGVAIAMVGPRLLTMLKVRDPKARGLALGASGHLVATARAHEEGPIAGAASSFALVVHGVLTVLASFVLRLAGLL
jgi:putative effector of murein hydrolase